MTLQRIVPGPGQESVWDYPRPPRVEPTSKHIQVVFKGLVIADTRAAQRVLETSHPPVYYIPPQDVRSEYLKPAARRTLCEFKGSAGYLDLVVGQGQVASGAWTYPNPERGYAVLRDHVAFYPAQMDACYVDGERVTAQAGDFYGGL